MRAGKKLLITGGAGFLGYYLVQTVLHWNGRSGAGREIRVTVYDNYVRGLPKWLEAISADPFLKLVEHDITHPLPHDIDDFQFVIHAASTATSARPSAWTTR